MSKASTVQSKNATTRIKPNSKSTEKNSVSTPKKPAKTTASATNSFYTALDLHKNGYLVVKFDLDNKIVQWQADANHFQPLPALVKIPGCYAHPFQCETSLLSLDPQDKLFYTCALLAVCDSETLAKEKVRIFLQQEKAKRDAVNKKEKEKKKNAEKPAKPDKKHAGQKTSLEHTLPPRRSRDSPTDEFEDAGSRGRNSAAASDAALSPLNTAYRRLAERDAVKDAPAAQRAGGGGATSATAKKPGEVHGKKLASNSKATAQVAATLPSGHPTPVSSTQSTNSITTGSQKSGYKFPFEIGSERKVLLIEGFDDCDVWIEKGKKKFLEGEIAKKQKSEGAYFSALCRALIRDKDSRGIREMRQRADKLLKDGEKDAGVQRIFGPEFVAVIKAYGAEVGLATNRDSVTKALNTWKNREFSQLKKEKSAGKK